MFRRRPPTNRCTAMHGTKLAPGLELLATSVVPQTIDCPLGARANTTGLHRSGRVAGATRRACSEWPRRFVEAERPPRVEPPSPDRQGRSGTEVTRRRCFFAAARPGMGPQPGDGALRPVSCSKSPGRNQNQTNYIRIDRGSLVTYTGQFTGDSQLRTKLPEAIRPPEDPDHQIAKPMSHRQPATRLRLPQRRTRAPITGLQLTGSQRLPVAHPR